MDEGVCPKTLQEIIPIDDVVKCALSDRRLVQKYMHEDSANTRASLYLCHLASSCRRSEIVTALLSAVADLNAQNVNGNTALHFASQTGNRHIVETLLLHGADVNVQTKERYTACHFASDSGNNETAEALIKAGIDIDVQNVEGDTALHIASKLGNSRLVKSLIAAGSTVNLQNKYGITALHNACQSVNAKIVKECIDAGAVVNANSCDGRSALHFALPDLSELPTHPLDNFSVPCYNTHHTIAEYLQELNKIVKLLIDAKIDVNQQCTGGVTALHIAVSLSDNVDLIEELIFTGADVNKVNDSGETALHYAHISNDGKVVQRLIEAGIDVDRQDINGDTALHRASFFAANESVRELVFAGADVNRRGYHGYTPLHYSMSGKCNVEVLEILLTSGASSHINDRYGLDPVQNIFQFHFLELVNVFKLQEHFESYRDVNGNTIFHLMIKCGYMYTKEELWTFIRAKQADFVRYLNVQNMFGQTPLHLAATVHRRKEMLDAIFSNFGECSLELLIKDEFGNTFLHTYFSFSRSHGIAHCNVSFIKRLLEGDYKNCPKEMIEKLVNSENETGNTPLHIFVGKVTQRTEFKFLLDMFLKAGVNINSRNSLGETVLHSLMPSFLQHKETAKIADVNIQNIAGESPIFIAPIYSNWFPLYSKYVEFLMTSGADMNKCNKLGQTALMMHVNNLTTEPIARSTIQMVLTKGGMINTQDIYGSNLLHYIAWSKDLDGVLVIERLNIFNWADFRVVQDHLGQLPCDVAFSRGHKRVLNELCVCKNGLHKENLIFCPKYILFRSLQQKDDEFQNYVHNKCQYFSESYMRCIMRIPLLGLVKFDEEANAVKTAIVSIVENICRRIGEKDELLTNTVILSGSVSENTKVGLPDEFDFLCVLDKISQFVDVECSDIMNLTVTVMEKYKGDACMRFFDGLFLSHEKLIDRFYQVLQEITQRADIYTHPNIFHVTLRLEKPSGSPNFELQFRWSCCKYKTMAVKIDLVPVCRIKCDRDSKLRSQIVNPKIIQNDTLLVLFHYEHFKETDRVRLVMPTIRVSASGAEHVLLATLPSQAKDAYVMSKILICDKLKDSWPIDTCASIISSYMLKNCLFHIIEEMPQETASVVSLHEYVCRIFQKLLQCAVEENLPCYMFPLRNLFTMKDKYEYRIACYNRAMYAKSILNILGKNEDFTDINPEIDDKYCNEYFNGEKMSKMSDFLYESEFPCDSNICANCKKDPVQHGISLEACSRCKLWTYCSVKCREENWRRHRVACDYHYGINFNP